ncbi:TonB-dependent receptor [Flagellimonas alvinocaridis]|uniref:TonB-dependent receptor n=1 Tax=Flagellimonas alvinocaridis TaxID=2530200 RepID=A0A4S8RHA4_9FLAO|nr:TonB-dependent receptor [Allomuricauda alvinocaridis]THV57290.1 TonB-dependent receptor [Allomuricauda alvinocaridis]
MKKLQLTFFLALLATLTTIAQEVTGTVYDDQNIPLPGVSILLKGTTIGTITDFDGKYTIEASSGDVLVFSYVGFNTQERTVSGTLLNVTLQAGLELENVVVVGSRNANRTATDTPVPVDVLDVTELVQSAPQVTVTEILNYAAPSFTSNPQSISDGTDHIAPAALRGLGPDQVLVLINGKRRHKTGLVNVNGTFGRGSVGTDMTTIPSNSISRIEILRDGAAAQYGSDAIAGVINIVLKKSVNELQVDLTTGANFTSEHGPDKKVDGEKINLGLNYGLPIGEEGGFINFTGNFNYRGSTNRMQEWEGTIFNAYNSIERVAQADNYDISLLLDDDLADIFQYAGSAGITLNGDETKEELQGILSADATESELSARGLQRSDFNMQVGQSEIRGAQFFANLSIPLGENLELYGFGGLSFKTGSAAGFYRLPNQSRTYTPAYLNGFLPEINSNITDQSAAFGIKGMLGDWNVDFSNSYGKNEFLYRITNSNNASLANSTPFEADSGGFNYSENTTNFDMSQFFDDILAGLNIAFGAEYRVENYAIVAGEEASYAQYNTQGNVHDPLDPDSSVPADFFGSSRPGGIQVFPGFKPDNEVDAFRNTIAGYFDVEADFTESILVSGAVRYENFSDFGGTLNFKLASRIKASENFNIRGGLQTGFRAPSLHQIHYSSTSTLFVDGIPNEVGIFPNTSRVARLLGIEPLKEETSFGVTAGFTARIPTANLKITLDGYLINIDDRVILTGQFDDNGNAELANLFQQANATQAAFFANSVDTQTKGLDLVVDHKVTLSDDISLTNTLAFTFSKTSVENIKVPTAIANAGLSDTYFDPTSRIYLEGAVPTTKGNLSHNLKVGENWSFFLRNGYFGEVEEATNNDDPTVDTTFGGKIITDLTVGYDFSSNLRLTIGANNLLDVYPDENDPAFRSDGRFIYSRRSVQFGTNGRHIFGRLTFKIK